ncbi:hypothetical protein C8K18_10470 [Paraburkholderia sp. GV068]|jgi:hypothetical protein|uniref:hypothetical protein n=1 Tax=unclassified Paraburkholderia TaxID=2615204 RepID=UPI000D2FA3AA|nr:MULTISPECIES: hypothetical protein [unclassified Paraburkholderia]PTR01767.1 hypothetical protein C8K19_10470 [Paraburkholderia sp. GV072]PUB05979.1 hypothetical protein C8K18_10470 [Paraburkholderia sp. GV068]
MRSTAMKSASNQLRARRHRANSRAITCAGIVLIVISLQSRAQVAPDALSSRAVVGGNVKRHADAVLAVMSYTTVPDVTTSSLSINSGTTGNPGFGQTQLGGGFTLSKSFPLYLEGTLAYSRYDPTFVATDGAQQRPLPTRWNTFSTTAGIGWDFHITDELVFRPILNGTIGRVSSDLRVGQTVINRVTDSNLQFLDNGSLDAYGYGGSLMLDYEHYRENYEIDVELRATDIYLRSFGGSSEAVQGSATAQQFSLWGRWRAPTGWHALDRPVRYVLETAYSHYFGDSAGVLGFNDLTSLGVGLELDSSRYPVVITRTRLIARYVFGHNVHGVSIGFAVSF